MYERRGREDGYRLDRAKEESWKVTKLEVVVALTLARELFDAPTSHVIT